MTSFCFSKQFVLIKLREFFVYLKWRKFSALRQAELPTVKERTDPNNG